MKVSAVQTKTAEAAQQRNDLTATAASIRSGTNPVLQLQRTLGNEIVQGLIQAKLTISQRGDPNEQEADRVADQIASENSAGFINPKGPSWHPGQAQCHGHRHVQTIHRKEKQGQIQLGIDPPHSLSTVFRGGGMPLPLAMRKLFEFRFGRDLSQVRVHTGSVASEAATSLNARAFVCGKDIAFGASQFEPESKEGRRLLAHELTHVIQQSKQRSGLPMIQRQPVESPTPPADNTLRVLPTYGAFTVKETTSGAEMNYRSTGKIFVENQSEDVPRGKTFAYNYFPATLEREYDIIRIVAAPGVSVRAYGFAPTPSYKDPLLQIFKVQDFELVPGKGESISPAALTGKSLVQADSAGNDRKGITTHKVVVERQSNGVDILNLDTKQAIKIRAPVDRGDAKFSYQIKLGGAKIFSGLQPQDKEPTVVTIVKTRSVSVSMVGLVRGATPLFFPAIKDVNNLGQVPVQGSRLEETGQFYKGVEAEADETLEQTLAFGAIDVGIGFIPIVGDLVDIAEFVYGIATGRDRWGRKLSTVDLMLMGVGAFLPIASGALLRGAKAGVKGAIKMVSEIGKNAEESARIVRGLSHLAENELEQIRRWDDLLRHGKKIPESELEAAKRILAKVGRAGPGQELSASTGRTLREVVNEAGTGFIDPNLQEAYRRFLSEVEGSGGKKLDPMEWLRTSQGHHRQAIEAFLGPQAAAIEFASNIDDYLKAVRSETRGKASMGRAWDYKRFPQLPEGVKWMPGDPIDMPNTLGNYPRYDMARQRHWQTRAKAELDARGGTGAFDPAAVDPVARLDDATLKKMLKDGTSPPGVELEHSGVPQRVAKDLKELGGKFKADADQLAGVSDPRWLFEVSQLEHAFFDYYAHTSHIPGRPPVVNPARTDILGQAWATTRATDIRTTRPLAYMTNDALMALIKKARAENANFALSPKTRALRDGINEEIILRGLAELPLP